MITVIKRNGKRVPFNIEVIERNIKAAALESKTKLKLSEMKLISAAIVEKIQGNEVHVEQIQKFVQISLMEQGFFQVATDYIEYKNKQKNKIKKVYKNFSTEFISKYKHLPDPFPNQLGSFVFYRTYSRFLREEKRRERWWETVARAVDYNLSLGKIMGGKKEAEQLFDLIYNLRGFLSGRTFWIGGTKVAELSPQANFNCAFDAIQSYDAFYELFYLLMIGSGVGLRITKEDRMMLPLIRTNIDLINKHYVPVDDPDDRAEHTTLEFNHDNTMVKIIVGDSKKGWAKALRYFFELLTDNDYVDINTIVFDYDNVRPKGEELKTFGGHASGHQALVMMFEKINKILKSGDSNLRRLKTIELMDIANIIGENVVSGGVRRTSEIILFDPDDEDILTAKNNIYTLVDGKWIVNEDIIHRQMSNNSILYKEKPTRERLHWQIEQMRYMGEPGMVNEAAAKKRRANFNGVNPCAEILLDKKGMCNLVTIVISAYVNENGEFNKKLFKRDLKLLTKAAYRMTNIEMELPAWGAINTRDKLIGVSMTGYQDAVNKANLSKEEQIKLLQEMRKIVQETAKNIAIMMDGNEPVLATTVKPEGTLSQLPTVSSGLHFAHSPYFIRRVRINADDPMVKVVKELGWNMVPEVGQKEPNVKTYVVEFPVKAPQGKTKYDVGAIEQLEIYKMFMENYVDHNASITVHVREHEWEEVEQWVWDNWDSIIAVSFISLDDNAYDLLPYEAISEEKYLEMKKDMEPFNPSLIEKYETGEDFELVDKECHTGACPIK